MFNLKLVALLLSIVFATFLISGCKKIVDSFPPRYVLNLRFIDQKGNDLLKEVQENSIRENITISSSDGEIISPSVEILELSGNRYLKIDVSSRPNLNLKQISYIISNKDLMVNSEVLEIITTWDLDKNNNTIKLLKSNGKIIDQRKEPIIHYELMN